MEMKDSGVGSDAKESHSGCSESIQSSLCHTRQPGFDNAITQSPEDRHLLFGLKLSTVLLGP